ncbi:MAG: D-sedoheptulose 7-phosphate isomerase [Saprospiraceae bacterium]|nr:D-sedoheptulose 7-phosphate isomerase [Saprospiraceae bacterium]
MDKSTLIQNNFREAIALKEQLLQDTQLQDHILRIADLLIHTFQQKGKVLFCGNGGSAADAQHLAAEFSGRYYFDRPPLPSEALHVNTSYLTAVANDYSYEEVYARLIRAMGNPGDVLIGLSTSGNSANVVKAFMEARALGMVTVGFTGAGGGLMKEQSDYLIAIPSRNTPRIQECHMLIGHSICEIVEAALFQRPK